MVMPVPRIIKCQHDFAKIRGGPISAVDKIVSGRSLLVFFNHLEDDI